VSGTLVDPPPVQRPFLDGDGLLRLGEHWTAIPESQLDVVEALLASPTVRYSDLGVAYARRGGTSTDRAVRMMVWRLVRRIRGLGLDIRSGPGGTLTLVVDDEGA
jgi:hypothetical protein